VNNTTLLLDTSCHLNFASERIVKDLDAELYRLAAPIEMRLFNGHMISASSQVTLCFRVGDSLTTYVAEVLILKDILYDMILGDKDIMKFGFLVNTNRMMLGCGPRKQSKGR
jgi:hypothetical protein